MKYKYPSQHKEVPRSVLRFRNKKTTVVVGNFLLRIQVIK